MPHSSFRIFSIGEKLVHNILKQKKTQIAGYYFSGGLFRANCRQQIVGNDFSWTLLVCPTEILPQVRKISHIDDCGENKTFFPRKQILWCFSNFLLSPRLFPFLNSPTYSGKKWQPRWWLGGAVVRALDLRLEVAGSIPAAALSSATSDNLFTHTVQRL